MSSAPTLSELMDTCGFREWGDFTSLSAKDGVEVYRARADGRSVIVKHFEKQEFRCEIRAYLLLQELDIPTLQVLGHSDSSVVLEDIADHPKLRLGQAEDLSDPQVAAALARWYTNLHARGARAAGLRELHAEWDVITAEQLRRLAQAFPETAPICRKLAAHLPELHRSLNSMSQTLTYNDFYWTNLAVAHDKSSALMFDYNLLGRGYRFGDLRNVCSQLKEAAADAFKAEYLSAAKIKPAPAEQCWDRIVAPLVTLIEAMRRPVFPRWALESKEDVSSPSFLTALNVALASPPTSSPAPPV